MPDEISNGELSQRKAVLEHLRDQLEQAEVLYKAAREAYEKAKKEYEYDGFSIAPNELKRVIEMREFTVELYGLAVKRFNDYLLHGEGQEASDYRQISVGPPSSDGHK